MSPTLVFTLRLVIVLSIISSLSAAPTRSQCHNLLHALQTVQGRFTRVPKAVSLAEMPGIYSECIHADEGIRFKKDRHLRRPNTFVTFAL